MASPSATSTTSTTTNDPVATTLPSPPIFSKETYLSIIREKRRNVIHQHYARSLQVLFDRLAEDAARLKPCHREATFEIPEHLNVDAMEKMIYDYFQDLGFKPLKEPRQEGEAKITVTLT